MTFNSRTVFAGVLLLSALLFSGCDTTKVDPVFKQGSGAPEVARFSVGDTVTVTLTGLPEDVPVHTEPIKEDGTITMPDIGHVPAAGKTAGELQNTIHDLYVPKIYTHITVTVTSGDRVYYVKGEVKQPGRLIYVGEITVTRAIASAGDFTDFADRTDVWLIRGKHRLKVNCKDVSEHPETDPIVYPGDLIEVRRQLF